MRFQAPLANDIVEVKMADLENDASVLPPSAMPAVSDKLILLMPSGEN